MSIPEMCIPPTYNRSCGRLTRLNKPCKRRADGYLLKCKLHSSPDELELAVVLDQVESSAMTAGHQQGLASAASKIEYQEMRISNLRTLIQNNMRASFPDRVIDLDAE